MANRHPDALDRASLSASPVLSHLAKALEASQQALVLDDTDRFQIRVALQRIEDELPQHERRGK